MRMDELTRKAIRNKKAKERYWGDPEYRRKSIAQSRARVAAYRETPEYRKKEREQQSAYRGRPDIKARESARYAVWKRANEQRIKDNSRRYLRQKRATDHNFRLKQNLRHLLGEALRKRHYRKTTKTADALGCPYEVFLAYIEDRFLPGMSWGNRSEWHIDHFTPMSIASTEEQVYTLSHYTNLSPMWGRDNQNKSDSILPGPIIKEASWAYDVIWAGKEG